MKKDDFNQLLMLGGVVVGGYLLYKLYNKVTNPNAGTPYEGYGLPGTVGNAFDALTGRALSKAGSAIGTALAPAPSGSAMESTYLTVNFEDGSTHAIPAGSVQGDVFAYQGGSYTLVSDAAGHHYAVNNG